MLRHAAAGIALLVSVARVAADDKVLFDFANETSIKAWRQIDIHALREAEAMAEAKAKAAKDPDSPPYKAPESLPKEPNAKIEWSGDKQAPGLKITFAGGRFPTIATSAPLEDWRPYNALHVDVTAGRTCMVVFRAMNENSKYGTSYNSGVSRWEFAARLNAGKNSVIAPAPPNAKARWKNLKSFEIYMYQPREGESITVHNIRLSTEPAKSTSAFNEALLVPPGKYKVLGADLEVKDVNELADRFKEKWAKPADLSAEQVEADFRTEYEALRKKHPRAVLAVLRDGVKGFDPANLDREFAGWQDAGTPSHLPMGLTLATFSNTGKSERIETCFRNRPGFLRVDLSSIPKGTEILAARLVVVRALELGNNWSIKPTMFVAEPCRREWKEESVNVFEYAPGHFWNDYAGLSWGEDGDCSAVMLAHGSSAGKTLSLDFANAVRYWNGGEHANHGFILYGAPKYVDYLNVFTRECKDIKNRPAVMVVYEPKGSTK